MRGRGVEPAIVSPATGTGTWIDSVGNSGSFVLGATVPGLPSRPVPASGIAAGTITNSEIAAGAIGGTQINASQVQTRVLGTCPTGQYVRGVNSDGTVTCEAVPIETAGPLVRKTFGIVSVPGTATSVSAATTLSAITFTAPVTGTALIGGRGHCNLSTGAASAAIYIGTVLPGETSINSATDWGIIQPPASTFLYLGFTTERSLAVSAGTTYTVALKAYQTVGMFSVSQCQGSYTVRLHVGTM